jgi:hypothetical protein
VTGTEEKRKRAVELTTQAVHAAMRDDWDAAIKAMSAITPETGGAGVTVALQALCDTIIDAQQRAAGLPAGAPAEGLVRPAWLDMETGHVDMDAAAVPPDARWAGQLLAARAAMDRGAWNALLSAMPADGHERGRYALVLLRACAATLAGPGGAR